MKKLLSFMLFPLFFSNIAHGKPAFHAARLLYSYQSSMFVLVTTADSKWFESNDDENPFPLNEIRVYIGPNRRLLEHKVKSVTMNQDAIFLITEDGMVLTLPALGHDSLRPQLAQVSKQGLRPVDQFEYLTVNEREIRANLLKIDIPKALPAGEHRSLADVLVCEGALMDVPTHNAIGFTTGLGLSGTKAPPRRRITRSEK